MSNNPFMPTTGATNPMPSAGAAVASSDSFEIDLTSVEQNNSYTIPDGYYRMKCMDVEQSVSKSGNPMFVWTFQIVNGQYTGREFKSFTAITPAAMWKIAETVQALGVGQVGQTVKFKRTDVIGKECGALIEATEYNGKTNSNISKVISLVEYMEINK